MAEPRGAAGMVLRQIRYQNRMFWRTPISAFFTFFFPVIFLMLFNVLFDERVPTPAGPVPFAQYFTPAIAAFAVVTACYTNLSIGTAIARDEGILKRFRGTPLPPWAYLAGRIGSAVWLALLSTGVLVALGVGVYGVRVQAGGLPGGLLALGVGAAAFCAIGLAATALMSTAESAPAVANATVLPVVFVSGVFFPVDAAPAWLRAIGEAFPVKHFVDALVAALNPLTGGGGVRWAELGIVAAWGVGGLAVALRSFRWEPSRPAARRRRRRARNPSG